VLGVGVNSLDERSQTFVVKIWMERRDVVGAPETWRGSVHDVRGGTLVYFATLAELLDFMRQRTRMAVPQPVYLRLLRHWRKG
jgi:hypothetical protein